MNLGKIQLDILMELFIDDEQTERQLRIKLDKNNPLHNQLKDLINKRMIKKIPKQSIDNNKNKHIYKITNKAMKFLTN